MRPVRLPADAERRIRRLEMAIEELGIDLDELEVARSPEVRAGWPSTWQQSQHLNGRAA